MMKLYLSWLVFLLSFYQIFLFCLSEENICSGNLDPSKRYLLYKVNPGEGFNLNRDVYLRMANLVRKLNSYQEWILVLPPWNDFYHWANTPRGMAFPWNNFFDLASLRKWVPVVELDKFIKENGPHIDSVYYLQHFAEGWGDKFEDKYERRDCIQDNTFLHAEKVKETVLWTKEFGFTNFSCLSFQGQASTIIPLLFEEDLSSRIVFIDRAETMLHDEFGSSSYWSARRSMRFAHHLVEEGKIIRKELFNSTDELDRTVIGEDWRDFRPEKASAVGGPYIAAHLRRRDFIYARESEVPSIQSAASQLKDLLKKHNLQKVFIATDAPISEFNYLTELLEGYNVHKYTPSKTIKKYYDGGAAIVEQIICSHARYFIGTFESTFSFRIQEEREILAFESSTTFNRFCGSNEICESPSKWLIVYPRK